MQLFEENCFDPHNRCAEIFLEICSKRKKRDTNSCLGREALLFVTKYYMMQRCVVQFTGGKSRGLDEKGFGEKVCAELSLERR